MRLPHPILPIPPEVLQDTGLDERSREQQVTLVRSRYEDLVSKLNLPNEDDWRLLEKAVVYAWGKHNRQKRDDGQPYIMHPLEVALILTDYSSDDTEMMVAALLHDIIEDCGVSFDTLANEFSPTIAFWVDGLTKISEIAREEGNQENTKQSINYRKLLLTIEQDVRIMIIKLADRLHNMRTLEVRRNTKRRETASQTFYFYVPIAEYLGLYHFKSELEDLSFRYLEPARYEEIRQLLHGAAQQHEQSLSDFAAPIEKILSDDGILCEVSHRTKSIYSISQKLSRKNVQFEDVYDLLAMRIVFEPIPDIPERTQCWYIYMLITERQTVMHERTRDWVTSPKVNGYQALHCTMLSKEGYWVEVQIRTSSMHRVAEYGVAAHTLYKGQGYVPANVAGIRQKLHDEEGRGSSVSFVDNFRRKIRTPELQVYAPDRQAYEIEQNDTALDFAFKLSTNTGTRAIAAKINGVISPLNRKLRGGDTVEIITATSQRITANMRNSANSSQAQSTIDMTLKKQESLEVENGRRAFRNLLHERGLDEECEWLIERVCHAMAVTPKGAWQTTSLKDTLTLLYSGLASGNINPDILRRKVRFYSRFAFLYRKSQKRGAGRQGCAAQQYEQLSCCYAIPGDEVIGHRAGDNKVYVHRTSCPEALRMEAQGLQSELVAVDWKADSNRKYLVHLYVSGYDRPQLLSALFAKLGDEMRINIPKVTMQSEGNIFRGVVALEVPNTMVVQQIVHAALAIPGIRKVYRVDREQVFMEEGIFQTVTE